MKRSVMVVTLLLLLVVVLTGQVAAHGSQHSLRGRWDVAGRFENGERLPRLTLLIQDVQPHPDEPGTLLANGCMRTGWRTRNYAPLALEAVETGGGEYQVTIYGTVMEQSGEPYVIRLDGDLQLGRRGVRDDQLAGAFSSDPGQGNWAARHHDRRRVRCPAVNSPSQLDQDVWHNMDVGYQPPRVDMALEMNTTIVSTATRVTAPDGEQFVLPFFTDLFSPDVDFVSSFRFQDGYPGRTPIAGEPYTFELLDIFGEPIAGTAVTDVWYGCFQDAPAETMVVLDDPPDIVPPDVGFFIDPVAPVNGFDPANNVGSYKITISPWQAEGPAFASHFQSAWHRAPWEPFVPVAPGYPDGDDFGVGLGELDDGLHLVQVETVSNPPDFSDGRRNECFMRNADANLYMEKAGDQLSFIATGAIAGRVTSEGGQGLPDVEIVACEYFPPERCVSGQTGEDGVYRLGDMLPTVYRVWAGNAAGYGAEFFEDTLDWEDAAEVLVDAGQETGGVDFALARGGSISGTVTDEQGNPLANIAVDIEQGGYGRCTDENGQYEMLGVAFGEYTVVAGRDFCEPHGYAETALPGIVLDEATPDVGGVDFALPLSGFISGIVTADEDGAPLAGAEVVVCQYDSPEPDCWSMATDGWGNYQIGGLATGDYRVQSWADGRAGEFYDDTIFWELAARVSVTAGETTEPIDFALVRAGNIHGRVTDESGSPLGGIAVDTETGGYGTCTDGNGDYTLHNVPYGTHTVVAGRNFCEPHPYQEVPLAGIVLDEVTPEVFNVDFVLPLAVP